MARHGCKHIARRYELEGESKLGHRQLPITCLFVVACSEGEGFQNFRTENCTGGVWEALESQAGIAPLGPERDGAEGSHQTGHGGTHMFIKHSLNIHGPVQAAHTVCRPRF